MPQRWCYLLVGTVLISGCAQKLGPPKLPKTYPVRGKVTIDRKPLPAGTIVLNPTSDKHGLHAEGLVRSDGSFEVETFAKNDGAVPGSYIVTFRPAAETKDAKAKDAKGKEAEHKKGAAPQIASKYLMPDSSNVGVEVKETDNDLGVINLESEKPPAKKK